jgi:hypothetical protein
MKVLKSMFAAALSAGLVFGVAGGAEAKCVSCNVPVAKTNVKTVVQTRTVQKVRNVTRVKNVNRTRYVKNVTRYVTRTVVVPVTRINTVTRVHNRTYVINTTQRVSQRSTGAGRTVMGTSRTVTVNHRPVAVSCGCGRG